MKAFFVLVLVLAVSLLPCRGQDNSLSELERDAKMGKADAQCALARHYHDGDGVPVDMAKACEWWKKSAGQGNAEAQYNLGVCLQAGTGINQDAEEAVRWYRKSMEQGFPAAMNALGVCYYFGIGVKADKDEAFKLFQRAADSGFAEAINNLGKCSYFGVGTPLDHDAAFRYFSTAAERGITDAMCNLGDCYAEGTGTTQDLSKAANLYRQAAEQGNPAAQNDLGGCYYEGFGVEQDKAQAIRWFGKAAEQGNPEGWFNMGVCSYYGFSADQANAADLFRNFAIRGDADAQYSLGLCYDEGIGVEKDKTQAVQWFRKSADSGNPAAQYALGKYYETGSERNISEAIKWYNLAAEHGIETAVFEPRIRTSFSIGTENEPDLSSGQLLGKIGQFYDNGNGVPRNFATAMGWYQKAAQQGYAQAETRFNALKADLDAGILRIPLNDSTNLVMVLVKAGSFKMGGRTGQTTLYQDYYIGQTEVTVSQYGTMSRYSVRSDRPQTDVSWNSAMEFCEKLNAAGKAPAGWKFTLPTEAQWEFAAKGGVKSRGYTYSGSNDLDEVGWYFENKEAYVDRPQPVAQKKPNELGLYDMSGNVKEWCLDDYISGYESDAQRRALKNVSSFYKPEFTRGNDKGGSRSTRDGFYGSSSNYCVPESRWYASVSETIGNIGFRLALVLDW